ncbi:EF-hand domain-containing protein D2-like isoform X1 [Hyperolius riggenbachi]|uniref:EF-hand domain-containing protein D2-like isoform X1 n=2 Tax=Hyperolius riggenbachi TaxID=752182 RepID=UPI0035A2BBFE
MAQSKYSGSHYALTAIGVGLLILGVVMAVWNLVPGFGSNEKPSQPQGNSSKPETPEVNLKSKTFSVAYVLVGAGIALLLLSICLSIRNKRKQRLSMQDPRVIQQEAAARQADDRYDAGKDGFIDLMELKLMMEKLGAPQTHLGLKEMIREVDEDFDGKLSFREFLLIFRKAAAGELEEDSGLHALARLSEIDVSIEGVKGAKCFFEAKVQAMNHGSRFEQEIKAEQEEKKRQAEEKEQRKAAFKELQSAFKP